MTGIFLELNGFRLSYELAEIVELVLNVESDAWKVDEIERWLRNKARKI